MTELYIFDLDGTLIDSQSRIVETLQKVLANNGYPRLELDEIKSHIGVPLKEIIKDILKLDDDKKAQDLAEAYSEIYLGPNQVVNLFDGVIERLESLKKSGKKIALATNKGHNGTKMDLELGGLTKYFDVIMTASDVVRAKPDPEMGLKILKRLNVKPEDAIMIGDTIYDIKMGKAAGVKTCAVTYGNHSKEMLAELKPDYIIDAIHDLP